MNGGHENRHLIVCKDESFELLQYHFLPGGKDAAVFHPTYKIQALIITH